MTDSISVLIADDHPMFRGGVARSLVEAGGFEIVAECGSAAEAVAAAHDTMPDVALLDVSMPGGGIEAAAAISRQLPAVKVVMLTVSEQNDDLVAAIKSGALGYVLKGVDPDTLIDAIRSVRSGGSYVSPSLARHVLLSMGTTQAGGGKSADPVSDLTAREEQILRLVGQGASNREIGEKLDLREATVKHYMTNILQKLHVRNRVEAALIAREKGL
ncbi:response regulator transcription factor [Paracoccus sp. TK19116]|uniref:Response regulator transcription factor n=1 Tax=Paracoccus albicereus TaxID=2922394 RepID=A0ABT1MUX2_9RHOB|nr:response regulator transcription factor [Paracoccus albicereus]MCQ0972130.1 response regulator transcription factor [Paracoccus albicereus]